MRPTQHVRSLVLAALAGCDRGTMRVNDDVDTDTDTDTSAPSTPDTDVGHGGGVFDPPDTDLRDWDDDGTPDPYDGCRGTGLVPDADGDGVCEDVDVCLGHDLTGNDDGDTWCDDVDPCDDRVVPAGTVCTPPSPIPHNPCAGEPRLFDGRHTGFVTCPNGAVDRLFATSGWLFPETETPWPQPKYWGAKDQCLADADCTDGLNGACTYGRHNGYEGYLSCAYGCDADTDCAADEACAPPTAASDAFGTRYTYDEGSPWSGRGRCVPASCRMGADCDTSRCALTFVYWSCSAGELRMSCRDTSDTCEVSAECRPWGGGPYVGVCTPGVDGFACSTANAVCGRPLRSARGDVLLAGAADGHGWHTTPAPALPPHPRVAAHWARVGLMEHASVASFARHALQLIALGAPADLLDEVAHAMADEVRHAQLALTLARALGDDTTPGTLPLDGVSWSTDVDAVLADLVHEGCVGETLAAAEAAWLAVRATDPTVRATLQVIAADEARHAALAWRAVAWLIDQHPHLRTRLPHLLDDALARSGTAGDGVGLVTWGVIDTAARVDVRAAVIDDVLAPALAQLTLRQAA